MSSAATRVCIAGGGPAGVVLGLLLARAGVSVRVLEKHADFLRDFRGDTIHPSTLELMHELGLLERLLELPHRKVQRARFQVGGETIEVADFSRLRVRAPFVALMPQWDFLDFLTNVARAYPEFRLDMRSEAEDLVRDGERVVGVRCRGPQGPEEIHADLVVAADGRHSVLRERAGLEIHDLGAPIDVLWFRLPRHANDDEGVLGRLQAGRVVVLLDRGDFWQCAFVIQKGAREALDKRGLDAFRAELRRVLPFEPERADAVRSLEDVKLLTVRVDRLRRWARPGLLCIGDAAHAMSPIGGVGINLAIQDAVAAANLLAEPLRTGAPTLSQLDRVQARRAWPTRVTQAVQIQAQRRVLAPALDAAGELRVPGPLRALAWLPFLRALPARAIGLGARPEHVRTPDVH